MGVESRVVMQEWVWDVLEWDPTLIALGEE